MSETTPEPTVAEILQLRRRIRDTLHTLAADYMAIGAKMQACMDANRATWPYPLKEAIDADIDAEFRSIGRPGFELEDEQSANEIRDLVSKWATEVFGTAEVKLFVTSAQIYHRAVICGFTTDSRPDFIAYLRERCKSLGERMPELRQTVYQSHKGFMWAPEGCEYRRVRFVASLRPNKSATVQRDSGLGTAVQQ